MEEIKKALDMDYSGKDGASYLAGRLGIKELIYYLERSVAPDANEIIKDAITIKRWKAKNK